MMDNSGGCSGQCQFMGCNGGGEEMMGIMDIGKDRRWRCLAC